MSIAGPTYLAFDIGGTKIASGFVTLPAGGAADDVADARPATSHERAIPTEASRGGDSIRERLTALCAEQLAWAADNGVEVSGIGIAAAGVPDSATGEIVSATDILPGWKGQNLYRAFAAVTDLPVHMVGDVGAHGLGEAGYGAGRGRGIVLSIGVGTGIGGAIVIDGRLFQGAHGVAGHAGHVPAALGEGFLCSCGTTRGHIEPVASGTGLRDLYNRRLEERSGGADSGGTVPAPAADGADVARRAADGEALARGVIEDSARALGECIGGMGNLIDPDVIVVSGSVVKAGPLWWDALREGFADSALPLVRPTPLVEGLLGGDAPLVGAAVAVHRSIA
ncbi:ROK family transcriptional regulator [Bifidobacterium sp. DSM 109958]|uniref:ROK family transcriptional regulator n=1 Tax=Bifidobacterium moraviense TaxID=2675323 RepID=A0A7Y0F3X8_9BIFI|nr:ROK family protein [Bifidobacterium sp. DSM 109958]NMN00587.1 ROK family transcriptional regulator [Bifidobacterium sp. DSM 109958]